LEPKQQQQAGAGGPELVDYEHSLLQFYAEHDPSKCRSEHAQAVLSGEFSMKELIEGLRRKYGYVCCDSVWMHMFADVQMTP
jgi:hypothetical protein